jgi:SAM-dependent methyltransferase
MVSMDTQPDQCPGEWDHHVSVYEAVFEPFSLQFAKAAIRKLDLVPGAHVLDVGAGSGGAALTLAQMGYKVTAIDASLEMCRRIAARAQGLPIDARAMDGQELSLPDASFDAAISVFGVSLFPEAARSLAEMRRVVKPGGRVAVVTWTEPQEYELAAEIRIAAMAVRPDLEPGPLPAQLRYRERPDFERLFSDAGLAVVEITVHRATLCAPSAHWLLERLAFAPGMSAQVASFGSDYPAIAEQIAANLEAKHGAGEVRLGGTAFIGTASV